MAKEGGQRLPDFAVLDFSGGMVMDKSDYERNRNEFPMVWNFDIDERGRLRRRQGTMQYAPTISVSIDNQVVFGRGAPAVVVYHFLATRANPTVLYPVLHGYTTAAVATTDTTITVRENGHTGFPASGNICIDGDVIAYTGRAASGDNFNLTGCTGIQVAHQANRQVLTTGTSITTTDCDGRMGVYFAWLNNLLFINGLAANKTFDGVTVSDIADADEPSGLFATTYRQRIHVAGAGSGTNNSNARRIAYSDAGDPTSWNLNSFFDVEEDRGDPVNALAVGGDTLIIFKLGSIFTYDEVELKQTLWNVGAYGPRVVQKIGQLFYTFCPSGVWVTNGSSAKKISTPIDPILRNFTPQYDAVAGRVVTNCFAGIWKEKYFLFLRQIVNPLDTSRTFWDCMLIYDTKKGTWNVHTDYTALNDSLPPTHFYNTFSFGRGARTGLHNVIDFESVFSADTSGKSFRLFENTFQDAAGVTRGGEIIANNQSNDAGKPLTAECETGFYDLRSPGWWKRIGFVRMLLEKGSVNVSYRLDLGDSYSDWISLGLFTAKNEHKRLIPNKLEGYRIALKFTTNDTAVLTTVNGFIFEEIEALSRDRRTTNVH